MHLLQDFVDVDAVAFLSPALLLLVAGADGLGFAGLLGAFGANFGWHGVWLELVSNDDSRTESAPFILAPHRRGTGRHTRSPSR